MALSIRKVPLTRDDMQDLIVAFKKQKTKKDFRSYLEARLETMGLKDEMVSTERRDDWSQDEVALIDYLLADVLSYSEAEDIKVG